MKQNIKQKLYHYSLAATVTLSFLWQISFGISLLPSAAFLAALFSYLYPAYRNSIKVNNSQNKHKDDCPEEYIKRIWEGILKMRIGVIFSSIPIIIGLTFLGQLLVDSLSHYLFFTFGFNSFIGKLLSSFIAVSLDSYYPLCLVCVVFAALAFVSAKSKKVVVKQSIYSVKRLKTLNKNFLDAIKLYQSEPFNSFVNSSPALEVQNNDEVYLQRDLLDIPDSQLMDFLKSANKPIILTYLNANLQQIILRIANMSNKNDYASARDYLKAAIKDQGDYIPSYAEIKRLRFLHTSNRRITGNIYGLVAAITEDVSLNQIRLASRKKRVGLKYKLFNGKAEETYVLPQSVIQTLKNDELLVLNRIASLSDNLYNVLMSLFTQSVCIHIPHTSQAEHIDLLANDTMKIYSCDCNIWPTVVSCGLNVNYHILLEKYEFKNGVREAAKGYHNSSQSLSYLINLLTLPYDGNESFFSELIDMISIDKLDYLIGHLLQVSNNWGRESNPVYNTVLPRILLKFNESYEKTLDKRIREAIRGVNKAIFLPPPMDTDEVLASYTAAYGGDDSNQNAAVIDDRKQNAKQLVEFLKAQKSYSGQFLECVRGMDGLFKNAYISAYKDSLAEYAHRTKGKNINSDIEPETMQDFEKRYQHIYNKLQGNGNFKTDVFELLDKATAYTKGDRQKDLLKNLIVTIYRMFDVGQEHKYVDDSCCAQGIFNDLVGELSLHFYSLKFDLNECIKSSCCSLYKELSNHSLTEKNVDNILTKQRIQLFKTIGDRKEAFDGEPLTNSDKGVIDNYFNKHYSKCVRLGL